MREIPGQARNDEITSFDGHLTSFADHHSSFADLIGESPPLPGALRASFAPGGYYFCVPGALGPDFAPGKGAGEECGRPTASRQGQNGVPTPLAEPDDTDKNHQKKSKPH